MSRTDIPHQRLAAQGLAGKGASSAHAVIHALGALQAQDYLGALWAVGTRMAHSSEKLVEQALAEGTIVRTWPLRGTLHFVAADDARWMMDLCGTKALARNSARQEREHGLDERLLARCRSIVTGELEGGREITRPRLYEVLEQHGIEVGPRGLQIIWRLAHEQLICFGPRRGKQQTLVLFDEWLPETPARAPAEAMRELAKRYFTSHGPATSADFAWWSGLTLKEARSAARDAVDLVEKDIAGQSYWSASSSSRKVAAGRVQLLPAFDEYTVAYRDRSAVLEPDKNLHLNAGGGLINPVIVIDGRIAGTWKRDLLRDSVVVRAILFRKLTRRESEALHRAADRYRDFLGMRESSLSL